MSFDWMPAKKYEEEPINVIEEYARIWGTRYSPDLYFSSEFVNKLTPNWESFIPENCSELMQISFDNRDSWINLTKGVTFDRPLHYEGFLVIRQILIIEEVHLLKLENNPQLYWFELTVEDEGPDPCKPKIEVNFSEDNDKTYICYC